MNISTPLASKIESIEFNTFNAHDIKRLSAKRIDSAITLDPLGHAISGGLYDPALGAWLDNPCSTCHLNTHSCPGHCGHIELPIPVYHPVFLPQLMHLLNGKCAYCGHLRISEIVAHRYVCKLKLILHGLLTETHQLDLLDDLQKDEALSSRNGIDDMNVDSDSDSDLHKAQALIRKQEKFVKDCISKNRDRSSSVGREKTQAATEARRTIIKDFLVEIKSSRLCRRCKGISPAWRKNGFNKVFVRPLPAKQQEKMNNKGFTVRNPLLEAAKQNSKAQRTRLESTRYDEGLGMDDDESNEEGEGVDIEMTDVAGPYAAQQAAVLTSSTQAKTSANRDRYVDPQEVYATIKDLFMKERETFNLIYSPTDTEATPASHADMFFIHNVLIPPNKFRPETRTESGELSEARENTQYKTILNQCERLNTIKKDIISKETPAGRSQRTFVDFRNASISLQDAVNSVIDQTKNPIKNSSRIPVDGIKQRLEKKEGLFRMHMMGKRVNFAARSVISPDPNIETNEIGVPPIFARKLTYPEPVNNHNYFELKQAVINGVDRLPGAAAIENESGQVINLRNKNLEERQALANQLLAPSATGLNGARSKKVHRHLLNGDVVLMNRQPTLHKPSMMAHRVRILPGEKTLRMHYANCNTYNADFDGDEMNMHFPQNELARAEAADIADTDHQYLSATAGKPLRGLIQDHISIGVWLTNRDTFFDREDYHQLLCSCLRPERDDLRTGTIATVPPAIVKPRPLWTGKQIVSTILKNITPYTHDGLNITGRSSTAASQWAENSEESKVIVDDGVLLCGIMDKAQLGPTSGGLIHAMYENYGPTVAGRALSTMGRMLTKLLHMRAFTCGMEDLHLTQEGNRVRREKLVKVDNSGHEVAAKYVMLENAKKGDAELRTRLTDVLRDHSKQAGLDDVYKSRGSTLSSEITSACLPRNLVKPFPRNNMQLMTGSGAKGSSVNANLISCNLGQQNLEGRRVPIMISGKTLPSFEPFDTSLRAGGYIADRFLTGVKPQEYYFHAMAGREGLIDTAVKTARSGYLQRCIIKGMEGLRTEYDLTVRDSDGSLVQFLYGEDGLDVTKQKMLTDFSFLTRNCMSMFENLQIRSDLSNLSDEAIKHQKLIMKEQKKRPGLDRMDPVLSMFNPSSSLGSNSEKFAQAVAEYHDRNPDLTIKKKDDLKTKDAKLKKVAFDLMMRMKYLKCTVEPGEAVGVVAGQSIGEPSTQMTLNTFHLAGHAGRNVTLGIPRLREIVMTASKSISTPNMTLHVIEELTKEGAETFAKGISKLSLAEIIDEAIVTENIGPGIAFPRAKLYKIRLDFFPAKEYEEAHAINSQNVLQTVSERFTGFLSRAIKFEIHKRAKVKVRQDGDAQPEVGVSLGKDPDLDLDRAHAQQDSGGEDDDGSDNDEDPEAANVQNKRQNRKEGISYEDPDDDEEALAAHARREATADSDSDDLDSALGGSPKRSQDREANTDSESSSEDEEDHFVHKVNQIAIQEAEEKAKKMCPSLTKLNFDTKHGQWCEIQLEYALSTSKLLLLPLVEGACRRALVQSIPHLGSCVVVSSDEPGQANGSPTIQTEGVNLQAMHEFQDVLNPHKIFSNDIWQMICVYGIEAGRATIVREMSNVFEQHSISVDNRHINLIGDFMTHEGGYKPFNRIGLTNSPSPLQKASFETTTKFIGDAVLDGDWDDLRNPSARIVAGTLSGVGTGAFDILLDVR